MSVLPRDLLLACADIGRALTTPHAEKLAVALAHHHRRRGADGVAYTVPTPAFKAAATRLLAAWAGFPDVQGAALGAAVAGAAHAHELGLKESGAELVISGPDSEHLHARTTEQALVELVDSAAENLLLVTFALYMYPTLRTALQQALARGVEVTVLAEDPADNLTFKGNPGLALAGLAVTRLRWASDQRPSGASLHAKVAVADRRRVLVSIANLTDKGANENLEVGLVIRGGELAQRISQHMASLSTAGVLVRLP